jgi:alpha-ketoglutarate-dependent taurine dioxygenase
MSNTKEGPTRALAASLRTARRQPLRLSPEELVAVEEPTSGRTLPLTLRPALAGVDPIAWATANGAWLTERLHRHGALLWRGFAIHGANTFERLIRACSGDPLAYVERSSPRTEVAGHIYTSTDYPAHQSIFPHCENSYQHTWPMRIFFCCEVAPSRDGETPIADCRRVLRRLPVRIVEEFERRGVKYVRNYSPRLGLTWQEVFQTDDRTHVDAYCASAGLVPEWKPDGTLRTTRVARAIQKHPVTQEPIWFNHAAFFHVTTLPADVREALLAEYAPEDLPNHTCYGDGTAIAAEDVEEIRQAYIGELVALPWQTGDVLMLDNMLVAHARNAFEGERRILVGMSDARSSDSSN